MSNVLLNTRSNVLLNSFAEILLVLSDTGPALASAWPDWKHFCEVPLGYAAFRSGRLSYTLRCNLENRVWSLSFLGKTSVVIVGGPIRAKEPLTFRHMTPDHVAGSFVDPFVPTIFEFSSSQASSDAFTDEVPSLWDSAISKWLISLPVHKLPLWISGISLLGWLPALSESSLWWCGSSIDFSAFSEVVLLNTRPAHLLIFLLRPFLAQRKPSFDSLRILVFELWYLA